MKISAIEGVQCRLGEGAVWDDAGGKLCLIDIYGNKLLRHDPVSGTTESWETPGHVGALALRESGGVVLAMRDGLTTLDFDTGALEVLSGPVFSDSRVTINDGAVDRAGRFVFGGCSAGFDDPKPIGGLYAFGPDHAVLELDRGIYQSNSHCFSPDGATLYAGDSFTFTLYAYDYDVASGGVANRRVFARTEALGGRPDGSSVDADGCVWMAVFEAGKVAAFRPDGRLERTVDLPVALVSSVAFGGAARDVLYVTTIDPVSFGRPAEAGAGQVFAIEGLGTRGVAEPRYAG